MTAPDPGVDDSPATDRQGPWALAAIAIVVVAIVVAVVATRRTVTTVMAEHPHGPIAADVSAPMGEPVPYATDTQLATFERGREVAVTRFSPEEGLGPTFNVTFCTACHERPVDGGSAGLYRNFFLAGTQLQDGSFVPAESVGMAGGVVRMFSFDPLSSLRPPLQDDINVLAQRNPISFFGVGLLAEVQDAEILSREDPNDADGDGISGRANFDQGFVGRFGRKAQTVSIEGFIRGPLFNHIGITTDPLTQEQKAALPVDSSSGVSSAGFSFFQAAAPASPLTDFDAAPDPEMSTNDLFDLVSYSMLLAAPEIEMPDEQATRGATVFDSLACGSCHTPRIESPRGPLPVYSDLLLHDMGEDLADGIVQGNASGSEFRTQPLWGLAAVGPYLHDGRASTIEEAILLHGGEAQSIRDAAARLGEDEMADLVAFLESLGGASQFSPGLIAPTDPPPEAGALGGPATGLSEEETAAFMAGRVVFDQDFTFADGVGAPSFNGDSCRACHFDPVVGGSGPLGVNVMRHGYLDEGGGFVAPEIGTILHKETSGPWFVPEPDDWRVAQAVFELRQTPPLFGLGLVDALPEAVILANADPDDADGDGISGVASVTAGGLGRFGWKAQVPSLAEFVRDAVGAELGMTMARETGRFFGILSDADDVSDAEFGATDADLLLVFMQQLAAPPRRGDIDDPEVVRGETLFASIGCSSCHIPALEGPDGPVPAYSDFLLHEILPEGSVGIEDGTASMLEFRTTPLWGLGLTGPYMHDGRSTTVDDAIRAHAGEAVAARTAFEALTPAEQAAILAFLDTL